MRVRRNAGHPLACRPLYNARPDHQVDGNNAPKGPPFRATMPALSGSVAEWFKAAVLKTAVGVSLPWVRIPLSPPLHFMSLAAIRGLQCT